MDLSPDQLWEIVNSEDLSGIERYGGLDAILSSVSTDRDLGIQGPLSLASRAQKYGANTIPNLAVGSFFDMLKEALCDQTLIILMICAVVSLVIEMLLASPGERSTAWIDGAAILAAVAIVSIVQASSNHKQEMQFAAVNRIKSVFSVGVVRNGLVTQIKNSELLVGDVVLLEQGNRVPADGLVLESEGLQLDQSTVNGESEAAVKDERDPFLFSNTYVSDGRGKMVVLGVGAHSHQGELFQLIANEQREETPLQEKLGVLAKKIGFMGVIAAGLTFAALMAAMIYNQWRAGWSWEALKQALDYLIVAVSIIAVAVPEGLPLAVTISLAYSMARMMDDNNFVRHLSACETMGSVTVICTDKTGTLTRNEMNVERVLVGLTPNVNGPNDRMLMRSIAVNSHAVIGAGGEVGSQTECALVRFVGSDQCDLYRRSAQVLRRFAFDRTRKQMSTIEQTANGMLVHVKGAPDEVLPHCVRYLDVNGAIADVDPAFRETIGRLLEAECAMGYRTLAIAYKLVEDAPQTIEEAESELVLLAIVSIRDSLRRYTARSIAACQQAGIRVIMITGDHLVTAQAIASECHLLGGDRIVITGAQLRKLPPSQLADVLPTIAVVARATPSDKHLIVTALKESDEIVAVTGDGTNDIPALIAADVGLSMGKCGTELAKEASNIVILDDDFQSIVRAVLWGRSVFTNIQRFLQYQLTANVATLFISFLSAVVLEDTPFKAVQLLWLNLIMDSLGALALATGKPHDALLSKKPNSKDTPLISRFMVHNIAGQASLQILLIGLIVKFPCGLVPHSQHHYTVLLNVFVLCQVFNLINARATESGDDPTIGFLDSPLFFGIMLGVALVQVLLVQIAGPLFSCTPLSLRVWFVCIVLAALTFPAGFILRRIPVQSPKWRPESKREDNQRLLVH